MTREQYIHKMKADLDRWNRQISAWEETVCEAQGDLRAKLQAHLDDWGEHRDLAALRLRELKLAGDYAWQDLARGADDAWRSLGQAYEAARQRFEQRPDVARGPRRFTAL